MMPPTKDQTDIGVENVIVDASDGAIDEYGKENKDMARQEFAKEADIGYMLGRFGVVPQRGSPTFGTVDDTVDLQSAINATIEAKAAYYKLPKELRDKFDSMEQFLNAVANGSLEIKNENAPEPAPQPPA